MTLMITNCSNCKNDYDINALKNYAINFNPYEDVNCDSFNKTPDSISSVINELPITDDYIESVMLVILKLYKYQMENYHQGYDIRRRKIFKKENPFIIAYFRILGERKGTDLLTPRIAYEYVISNKQLLKNSYILDEYIAIKNIEKEIEQIH